MVVELRARLQQYSIIQMTAEQDDLSLGFRNTTRVYTSCPAHRVSTAFQRFSVLKFVFETHDGATLLMGTRATRTDQIPTLPLQTRRDSPVPPPTISLPPTAQPPSISLLRLKRILVQAKFQYEILAQRNIIFIFFFLSMFTIMFKNIKQIYETLKKK